METKLKIRPYARLLTMLGEQLITNEQIALAELIKNAYDADADWVKVCFEDFDYDVDKHILRAVPNSRITIEDNGCGMTLDAIKSSWMNPATPNKKSIDTTKTDRTPKKKRIIQGEKGIGRFAVLKLGRDIKIYTRPENGECEYCINFNLSQYDDDFLTERGERKDLFIDDIDIVVSDGQPSFFIPRTVVVNNTSYDLNNNHGTRIEISNLKGQWSYEKIETVSKNSLKLESIFERITHKSSLQHIEIGFECNSMRLILGDKAIEELSSLLQNSSVLKITEGHYVEKEAVFSFKMNGVPYTLPVSDPQISGLRFFRSRFIEGEDLFGNTQLRKSSCGNFDFNFYVFDFVADKESPFYLSKQEKEIIKEHRIYLYRDNIRVAPYGDPDNDWLEIDKWRGVGRAGDFLSNDQVVGFVDISKTRNPLLKDKTNREGLIEEGYATRDFIVLLHSFLLFVRQHPYKQYQERVNQQKEQKMKRLRVVASKFDELKTYVEGNSKALSVYNDLVNSYKVEQRYYTEGLNKTEDLAAVGLSVETASHDLSMMLNKGVDAVDNLIKDIEGGVLSDEQIENELHTIRGIFSFVKDRMRDIQLLFKSSKQRRRPIRVNDLLEKVEKIYKRALLREHIDYSVNRVGSPIVVSCTDAVILQLLINLFDNAVYWLKTPNIEDKRIRITLNGDNKHIIFSDNGPGVREDDKPFIFEAFYSGKEDGRGLGLYIARQLLQRMGYSISLAETQSEKVLSGANFVINFIESDDND